jgi:hypothetical protein
VQFSRSAHRSGVAEKNLPCALYDGDGCRCQPDLYPHGGGHVYRPRPATRPRKFCHRRSIAVLPLFPAGDHKLSIYACPYPVSSGVVMFEKRVRNVTDDGPHRQPHWLSGPDDDLAIHPLTRHTRSSRSLNGP